MPMQSRRSSTSTDETLMPPTFTQLSSSQRAAFEQLKCLCTTNNVCWRDSISEKDGICPNDNDTLLRYLRARDYDAQAAFQQYKATVTWRRKIGLDDIFDNAEVGHFETMRRMFPQWTGRRDRCGVPVLVYVVSQIRPEDLLRVGKEDPDLSTIFLPAENSTQFIQPLCARMHADGSMPFALNIIDLSGVGVRLFWNLRALLQKASTMATAHYPESVDKIFIIGAPSFFPTIWGFVTKWFEPTLTSKIFVLPAGEVKSTLTSFIEERDLPIRYGGGLDWDYGMHPNLDEETKALVGELGQKWIPGPLKYVSRENSDSIVAIGKTEGSRRQHILAEIPFREASF